MGRFYRLNDKIQAQELRVIDADGNQLGVISKIEALTKARELGLDLVEVASNANPPVARIQDFQKFKYDENKREQAAKKNAKSVEVKELWLTPRIAEHDLETRIKRAEEFLNDGDKIQFRVKFKGREMAHLNFGFDLLKKIVERLGKVAVVDRDPKVEGRSITMIVAKGKSKQSNGQPPQGEQTNG